MREVPLLLRRSVKRFRAGLVFKADRLVYHSTQGSSLMKKYPCTRQDKKAGGDASDNEVLSFFFFMTLQPRVE